MPTTSDSVHSTNSSSNNSTNLLANLSQFKYEKTTWNKLSTEAKHTSDNEIKENSPKDDDPKAEHNSTPNHSADESCIPETPEHKPMNNAKSLSSSNHRVHYLSSSEDEIRHKPKKRIKTVAVTSSDDEHSNDKTVHNGSSGSMANKNGASDSEHSPCKSKDKSKKEKTKSRRIVTVLSSDSDDNSDATETKRDKKRSPEFLSETESGKSKTHVLSDDGSEEDKNVVSHRFGPNKGVTFIDSDDDECTNRQTKCKKEQRPSSSKKKVFYVGSSEDELEEKKTKTKRNHGSSHNSKRPKSSKKTKKKQKGSSEEDSKPQNYKMLQPVYDSDESDNYEETDERCAVMSYFNEAPYEELINISRCRHSQVETIMKIRPFKTWRDLLCKVYADKTLSTELLNGAQDVMHIRKVVTGLMKRCEKISVELGDLVNGLVNGTVAGSLKTQPTSLTPNMCLTEYQMLGLNWLALLHRQNINGILADEMGLGKTIQAIAFLAHLKEEGDEGPHLIVVPSSTLENWTRELNAWCPSLEVITYYGSQAERARIRQDILYNKNVNFNVLVTTYNMLTSSKQDRVLVKKLDFLYVVFDEAHMLKNVSSARYKSLMTIQAKRRLLLTGTPLQNNLVELMSLLMFVVPDIFSGKTDEVKQMFSKSIKTNPSDDSKTDFERERIDHAKKIMRPFVLRRLKNDVLKDLPKKSEQVVKVPLSESQKKLYENLVTSLSSKIKEQPTNVPELTGIGMVMQLRKLANHPLLLRTLYDDLKLRKMSKEILRESTHFECDPQLVYEDMCVMSDFELHKLSSKYKSLYPFKLDNSLILDSGKFNYLDDVLPSMMERGDRVLLFSQFLMVLDIVEDYLKLRKYTFVRLDGQTGVGDRQTLIDTYTKDESIFIFLLSTRAGGLGINLTAANVVIIHDIDFNPYNDKQAEDRCHRVGQTREVSVVRLISDITIEEGILSCAEDKLRLERDVTGDDEKASNKDVAKLLKVALGLSH